MLAETFQAAPLSEDACFLFAMMGWGIVWLNAQRIVDHNAFLQYGAAAFLFGLAQIAVGPPESGLHRAVFLASPCAAVAMLRISLALFFPGYPNAVHKPVIILGRNSWKSAPHYQPSVREKLFSVCQFLGMILWAIVGNLLR
ncbi:hypothetical protein [Hymenobacter elongatus]|uniref:Uncharacterized protein n=1 Tax=Hymenobacter elongatus TaxID=877208 RepID=A0A4Z0PQ94_9BACT|nr:hypothetical protein [Hymenobacter elongatus]TGE19261.1 hypothetical protein E5J99_03205 [Hymenobacter elongatus]